MLSRHSTRNRKGTATVELAFSLPMIVLLVFGTIETTSLISFRQRLLTAAFEAARTTSAPLHTSTSGIAAGKAILDARGVNGATITVSPDPVTSKTPTGTEIAATVTAPFASNACMQPIILRGVVTDVTVTVRMIRQ
jgi:Flp pilus assembly protein TadG